jgi:hypothetical protein
MRRVFLAAAAPAVIAAASAFALNRNHIREAHVPVPATAPPGLEQ